MPSVLQLTLILLASGVAGVLIFRYFGLPPILGYLAIGVLIGPKAFGIASDSETVRYLAEFGVVFLMFSIGLEFNLQKLRSMRSIVFGLGASQVLLTMVLAVVVSPSSMATINAVDPCRLLSCPPTELIRTFGCAPRRSSSSFDVVCLRFFASSARPLT